MGTSSAGKPTRDTVSEVWSEILEIEVIDTEADFFAIGGDSRTAARIVTRLRQELEIESLPLILLFECPTVSSLAQAIDDLRDEDEAASFA